MLLAVAVSPDWPTAAQVAAVVELPEVMVAAELDALTAAGRLATHPDDSPPRYTLPERAALDHQRDDEPARRPAAGAVLIALSGRETLPGWDEQMRRAA